VAPYKQSAFLWVPPPSYPCDVTRNITFRTGPLWVVGPRLLSMTCGSISLSLLQRERYRTARGEDCHVDSRDTVVTSSEGCQSRSRDETGRVSRTDGGQGYRLTAIRSRYGRRESATRDAKYCNTVLPPFLFICRWIVQLHYPATNKKKRREYFTDALRPFQNT
jgi:hypothetical protein